MIDHAARIRGIFKEELGRLKLGDSIGFAVEGPTFVPTPNGQITSGWIILVTVKHKKLIGVPDVGVSVPIMGVLPPDEIFKQGAAYALEEARKARAQQESMPLTDPSALPQDPVSGQPLPPGLVGKGLSDLMAGP